MEESNGDDEWIASTEMRASSPTVHPFHPLPIPIRWQPVMELQIRRHYMPLGNLWFRARFSANIRPVTFLVPFPPWSWSPCRPCRFTFECKSIRSTSRFYHSNFFSLVFLSLSFSLSFSHSHTFLSYIFLARFY